MPFISMRLPEVEKSIARPAVLAVVRQVMEITGIPQDIHIAYKDDASGIAQNGSTQLAPQATSKLIGESLLSIEVEDQYDQNTISSTAVTRPENRPIMMDDDLGIFMRPIYSHNEFTVSVIYNSKSRNEALGWRDMVRLKVSEMRDVNLHHVSYHFPIPDEYMFLLHEFHRMREAVAPYGEDFDTWFAAVSSTKMTRIANQSGKSARWAFTEQQLRIQGMFGFGSDPEQITKGSDGGKWTVQFTYKFSFDKPLSLQLGYPIMIHNQLVNPRYIPEAVNDPNDYKHDSAASVAAIDRWQTMEVDRRANAMPVVLKAPTYDEWVGTNAVPGMARVFTVLCEIEPSQPRYLLDLHELGDFQLDAEVIEYLEKVEWKYLNRPTKSMFHVSVYRNAYMASFESFHVTEDLKVMMNHDCDLRRNHRVVLSFMDSILKVDREALRRMAFYPNVLRKVLLSIGVNRHHLELVRPRVDLMRFFPELPHLGSNRSLINANHVGFNTVNTAFVTSRKLRDYGT